MSKQFKTYIILAILVAIIVPSVALAAWWNPFSWGIWNRIFKFQQTEQKQEQQIKKEEKQAEKQDKKLVPVADPTAGWKTYTNTQYGFELKYPTEWSLKNAETTFDNYFIASFGSGPAQWETAWPLLVRISSAKGKIVPELDNPNFDTIVENVKIDGVSGFIFTSAATMNGSYVGARVIKNNYLYQIGISSNPPKIPGEPVPLLKKIISTFKFTN